ncbi:hypothetical protein IMSAG025_01833 [Muribaculaceae bacterium]|nr:hypothetical protein IMSAG025_01833 [Muribaculaceae bacterium]
MDVRGNGYIIVSEQILLRAVEVVERTVDTIVKQREVQTYVPVLPLLPLEVGIDILSRSPHLEIFAVVIIISEAAHGVDGVITSEVLISGHTIVCTDFEVVDPCHVFHEILLRYTPSG